MDNQDEEGVLCPLRCKVKEVDNGFCNEDEYDSENHPSGGSDFQQLLCKVNSQVNFPLPQFLPHQNQGGISYAEGCHLEKILNGIGGLDRGIFGNAHSRKSCHIEGGSQAPHGFIDSGGNGVSHHPGGEGLLPSEEAADLTGDDILSPEDGEENQGHLNKPGNGGGNGGSLNTKGRGTKVAEDKYVVQEGVGGEGNQTYVKGYLGLLGRAQGHLKGRLTDKNKKQGAPACT